MSATMGHMLADASSAAVWAYQMRSIARSAQCKKKIEMVVRRSSIWALHALTCFTKGNVTALKNDSSGGAPMHGALCWMHAWHLCVFLFQCCPKVFVARCSTDCLAHKKLP